MDTGDIQACTFRYYATLSNFQLAGVMAKNITKRKPFVVSLFALNGRTDGLQTKHV